MILTNYLQRKKSSPTIQVRSVRVSIVSPAVQRYLVTQGRMVNLVKARANRVKEKEKKEKKTDVSNFIDKHIFQLNL